MPKLFTLITFAKDFYKNNQNSLSVLFIQILVLKYFMQKTNFHYLDFLKSLEHFKNKNGNVRT